MCAGQQTWAMGPRGDGGQFGFGDHTESRGTWEASATRRPGLGSPRKGPQDGQGGLMGGQLRGRGGPQAGGGRRRPGALGLTCWDACLPTGSWNILAGGRGRGARGQGGSLGGSRGLYGRGQSTLSHLRGMAPPAPRSSPQQPGRDLQTALSGPWAGAACLGAAAHLWPGSSPEPHKGMCVGRGRAGSPGLGCWQAGVQGSGPTLGDPHLCPLT